MKSRLLIASACLLIFTGLQVRAQTQSAAFSPTLPTTTPTTTAVEYRTPPVVEDAIKRRVLVKATVTTCDNIPKDPFYSTGSVVATNWVITNTHAVTAEGLTHAARQRIAMQRGVNISEVPLNSIPQVNSVTLNIIVDGKQSAATLRHFDVTGDMALLQTTTPDMPLVPFYPYRPQVFQPIFYAGNPGMDAIVSPGTIVGVKEGTLIDNFSPMGGGMSGSFLYTYDGFLIGVQKSWKPSTGAGYASSIDLVAQFFRDTYDIHTLTLPEWMMALKPRPLLPAPMEEVKGGPCVTKTK